MGIRQVFPNVDILAIDDNPEKTRLIMFGLLSVPWDFFHIGLLIVVIMIMITGMVICVSVIGVCCFHWLERLESTNESEADGRECQYNNQQQSVHVIVVPEKGKPEQMDPCQLREHYNRLDAEMSMRRFLHEDSKNQLNGPPPSYDMLYPIQPPPSNISDQ